MVMNLSRRTQKNDSHRVVVLSSNEINVSVMQEKGNNQCNRVITFHEVTILTNIDMNPYMQ